MIQTDKLKGEIARAGLSQSKVARELGITPKTFYEKMKIGVFGSDEIQKMIALMKIESPLDIFFAPEVTFEVTKEKEAL